MASPIFRSNEREAADAFRLKTAHRGAGHLAKLVGGKILGFAATDEQQTLRLQAGGFVQ